MRDNPVDDVDRLMQQIAVPRRYRLYWIALQLLKRGQVVRHISVRWIDDDSRAVHDVVARIQAMSFQMKVTKMI